MVQNNIIGMTLGHGNDLVKNGFKDDVKNKIYIKSWMEEYFLGEEKGNIDIHAKIGLSYWKEE